MGLNGATAKMAPATSQGSEQTGIMAAGPMANTGHSQVHEPIVRFRLLNFGNDRAQGLVTPGGCMVFQGFGPPRDTQDHTWIPTRSVGCFGRPDIEAFDYQWYRPLAPPSPEKVSTSIKGTAKVGQYLVHARKPDAAAYPVTSLAVDGQVIQALEFQDHRLFFYRLGHLVELDLSDVPANQRFTLVAAWSPVHLELRATWMEGDALKEFHSGEGVDLGTPIPAERGLVRQYKARTDFALTLIPPALASLLWRSFGDIAKRNDADPKTHDRFETARCAYKDADDLLGTFRLILSEVHRILERVEPVAFWDRKEPKPEPEAGWALRSILEALCPIKNLRIYQEDPSRSGRVDFVFSGISEGRSHLELVMELKHAHSARLKQGLTGQLPQYARERGFSQAVYGVLWYKGRYFDRPSHGSLEECLRALDSDRPESVALVCGFDLSFREHASKVKEAGV